MDITLYVPLGAPLNTYARPKTADGDVAAVDGLPSVVSEVGVGTVFNYTYDSTTYALQIQPLMAGNGALTFSADADLGEGAVTITTTYSFVLYEPGVGFGP